MVRPSLSAIVTQQAFSNPFAALLPDACISTTLAIDNYYQFIHSQEQQYVANAIEKRRNEFSTGRLCTQLALQQHKIYDAAVLIGNNREPIWPTNLTGSISHCHDIAGAVVVDNSILPAVGIDIERLKPLKERFVDYICTDEEKAWLNTQTGYSLDTLLLMLFSLKEAIYKCVYVATDQKLTFKDCNILPDLSRQTAQIKLSIDTADLTVKYHLTEQHCYSCAYIAS